MSERFLRLLAVGLVVSFYVSPVEAQSTGAEYARVNASLARTHIVPSYKYLAKSTAEFQASVYAYCAKGSDVPIAPVRTAFSRALKSWMKIDHVHLGPVQLLMRNFRIHFWPDKGGRGSKQILALLKRNNNREFAPEKFRSASVAVQGLPAAERLLFDLVLDRSGDKTMLQKGCQFIAAIAGNIKTMSAGIAAEWKPYRTKIVAAGGEDAFFKNHKEVTTEFLRGMCTSLQSIVALKLERPLGKSLLAARPKRSESWRSGNSLANIIANLNGTQAMFEGERDALGLRALIPASKSAIGTEISTAFKQSIATASRIVQPLYDAVGDPVTRPKVDALLGETRKLRKMCTQKLAEAIGVQLAFNSLDGD